MNATFVGQRHNNVPAVDLLIIRQSIIGVSLPDRFVGHTSYCTLLFIYIVAPSRPSFSISCRSCVLNDRTSETLRDVRGDVRTLSIRGAIALMDTSFVSPNIIHRAGRWRNICSIASKWAGTSVSSCTYIYIDEYVKRRAVHDGDLSRIIFGWVIRQDYLAYFAPGVKNGASYFFLFLFRTDHSGHERIASSVMYVLPQRKDRNSSEETS